MRIVIPPTVVSICQPQAPACLLTNNGANPIYLGDASHVTIYDPALILAPRQSVNWRGGALWGLCGTGKTSELLILSGGDTSVTPITDVSINAPVQIAGTVPIAGSVDINGTVAVAGNVAVAGPVTVNGTVGISGGTMNVGTVSGNVNVDGSTINIGNNVRLWGGGDYLGYYDFPVLMPGFATNLALSYQFPGLLTGKYKGVRLYFSLTGISGSQTVYGYTTIAGEYSGVLFPTRSQPIVGLGSAVNDISLGYKNGCFISAPITSNSMWASIKFSSTGGGTFGGRVHCVGTYEETPTKVAPDTPIGGCQLANLNRYIYLNDAGTYKVSTWLAPGVVYAGTTATMLIRPGELAYTWKVYPGAGTMIDETFTIPENVSAVLRFGPHSTNAGELRAMIART